MRITKEFILKFTSETITRRARSNRDLLAAYLCGSFLGEAYLLGGAGDVDLVFVYDETPAVEREVIRLTDEIHLDIANHDHRDYRDTRRLRVDPWRGSMLKECKILHDPQHFLDFVQASVRGQFDRPDRVFQRARPLADKARATWFHLQDVDLRQGSQAVRAYLGTLEAAANSIAMLSGPPLTERRLLLDFSLRAEILGRPGLFHGLLGLLGANHLKSAPIEGWLEAWRNAYTSLPDKDRPARFHHARLRYYLDAFKEMKDSEQPFTMLWPLLETWTELAAHFPADSDPLLAWQRALESLELFGPGFTDRVVALDAFLDTIDESLETWAQQNGV